MSDLSTAVKDAEKQLQKEIADKGGKLPPTSVSEGEPEVQLEIEGEPEGESEAETETQSDDEPDLSESELDEANRLYKALKNKQTAGPIIAALAAQAGLHLTQESTKTEVREAKKSIQDKVADALGEQYKFLAPQLGKAIESALESVQEENEVRLTEIRQSQVERDVTVSYEKLARETKGESKKLEARMAALSEEIPIGSMTVDTYIRRLYTVASAESQKSSARQIADKIRRNAGDVPSRLRGTAAGPDTKLPDKKMGLKESVNWAIQELSQKK